MVKQESQVRTKPIGKWLLILGITVSLGVGGVYLYNFLREESLLGDSNDVAVAQTPAEPTAVAALGRLEPEGKILRLSAPNAQGSNRIDQIFVQERDQVEAGERIAVLDTYASRQAALEKAQADVETAQASLARVKAGAREGEIQAQRERIGRLQAELSGQIAAQTATIARLESDYENAQVEYERYEMLYEEGAVSASERDSKRLRVNTTQAALNEAQQNLNRTKQTTQIQQSEAEATLDSISEVRPVDVQVAEAELKSAIAILKQAQTDLDLATINSPINGQILKLHVRPGEVIGNQGIAEIGHTDQMYVVAQVYETDIAKVRPGQKTTITGAAFSGEIQGEVSHIGLQVGQQDVFEGDPLAANTDNKVVEVKIRLDPESSQQVADLSNLQVQTVIHL